MVNVVGFDVGGVNVKSAFITYSSSKIIKKRIQSKFYPMWLHTPEELLTLLQEMISELSVDEPIDAIGITMTAEVSDVYYTKKEGVSHILSTFSKILPQIPKKVITNFNQFISIPEALENYMAVASANWVATALFIGKKFPKCILLDIGSTTTDIIPISHGLPDTIGKTDMDRLLQGELVYTGALRSTIPSIVHKVPIRGTLCPISFEKFALIADVHLLLDHISAEDYRCDTADERQKTKQDALARLARIICADVDLLSEAELYEIVTYIYERQLDQISAGITQVLNARQEYDISVPVVITGLGREFLARRVAEKIGFHQIFDLEKELGIEGAIASPAAAIAILLAEKYEVT
jgi:probable H4MPT-linked C1 transfer pathway protein